MNIKVEVKVKGLLKGVSAYGVKYIHYSVLGDLFKVSSNYAKDSETKEDVAIKQIGNAFNNSIDAKRATG